MMRTFEHCRLRGMAMGGCGLTLTYGAAECLVSRPTRETGDKDHELCHIDWFGQARLESSEDRPVAIFSSCAALRFSCYLLRRLQERFGGENDLFAALD